MVNKNFKQMYLDKYENVPSYENSLNDNTKEGGKTINYYLNKPEGINQMLEAIHEILENLDFENIHNVMQFLNWQWRNEGVPSIEKLKEELLNMLAEMFDRGVEENQSGYMMSCGGFTVQYKVYENDADTPDDFKHNVNIYVAFNLDTYDTFL